MRKARFYLTAVILCLLTLVAVPSVQAETQEVEAPSVWAVPSWFEIVKAWVGQLLGESPESGLTAVQEGTGSCIDPLGNPTPCGDGG
jgi:hypothetical protein